MFNWNFALKLCSLYKKISHFKTDTSRELKLTTVSWCLSTTKINDIIFRFIKPRSLIGLSSQKLDLLKSALEANGIYALGAWTLSTSRMECARYRADLSDLLRAIFTDLKSGQ